MYTRHIIYNSLSDFYTFNKEYRKDQNITKKIKHSKIYNKQLTLTNLQKYLNKIFKYLFIELTNTIFTNTSFNSFSPHNRFNIDINTCGVLTH